MPDVSPVKVFLRSQVMCDYLRSLRWAWSSELWHFLIHVWKYSGTENNGVPIPANWIREYFRGIEQEVWELVPDVLHVDDYRVGKCRYYSVNPRVWQEAMALQLGALMKNDHSAYSWDLVTRQPTKRGRHGNHLTGVAWTNSRHRYPALLTDAIKAIQPLRWNRIAVQEYVSELSAVAQNELWSPTSKSWYMYSYTQHFLCDLLTTHAELGNGIVTTPVPMGICDTGRLKELGIALLGAWDELRRVALTGVEYFNYDIVSCHLQLLMELLEEKNETLARFASKPKGEHIDALEIYDLCYEYDLAHPSRFVHDPEKVWKELLYSLLFSGGNLNTMPSWDFYHLFEHRYASSKSSLNQTLKTYFEPLLDALDRLYAQELAKTDIRGRYVNRVGMTLFMSQTSAQKKKSELLAHIIQGAEASIICRLILKCRDKGINTLSYQYDGLVVDKAIPETIIHEVIAETGLNFKLKLKKF